jgi:hypothetical protein
MEQAKERQEEMVCVECDGNRMLWLERILPAEDTVMSTGVARQIASQLEIGCDQDSL